MSTQNLRTLRWWILEDALRDTRGHWFDYLRTFKRGLEAEGDLPQFFVSKECNDEVREVFSAFPILPPASAARARRQSRGARASGRLSGPTCSF